MTYDVIIIGGGIAGISAACWCADLGMRAVVLEINAEAGGQLLWTHNPIGNYPGFRAENGREFYEGIAQDAQERGLEIKPGIEIKIIDPIAKSVALKTGETMTAKALIVATGVRRRKLNVPGEDEFVGRGILSSGAKEKEKVSGLDVCIVGGGDAAFENALMLAEFARSVTVVHRGDKFRARKEFTEKVFDHSRINVIIGTTVSEILGSEEVESLKLVDTRSGQTNTIAAQAVLIRIGVEPNTEFLENAVELDEKGFVLVDSRSETSVENVYAAGDVASPDSMTLSTASGMGATAANAIFISNFT